MVLQFIVGRVKGAKSARDVRILAIGGECARKRGLAKRVEIGTQVGCDEGTSIPGEN